MPCDDAEDWTAVTMLEEGTDANVLLDNWGARDSYMYLWHRGGAENDLHWRRKRSK